MANSVNYRYLLILQDDHSTVTVDGLDADALDVDQFIDVKERSVGLTIINDQLGLARADARETFRDFIGRGRIYIDGFGRPGSGK